jgi:hypothetical protein
MDTENTNNGARNMDAIMITAAVVIADIKVDCPKCGGQGTLDGYAHIQHGVCFRCSGAGRVYLDTLPEKFHAPYIAAAQERADRKAAHDAAQAERDGIMDMIVAGVELEMGRPWFSAEPDADGLLDPFSMDWEVNEEISRRVELAEAAGLLVEVPAL